ncbi:MAG: rhomboid family intramembrane serine protease [Bacteroidia bacterium]
MPRFHITPVVLNLIIINALVFVALNLYLEDIFEWFFLFKSNLFISRPYGDEGFRPVQIVSSMFSHVQVWHLLVNMFALFNFGPRLEMIMGPRRFLLAYLVIGVASSAITGFFDPSHAPVVGASGVLFGMTVLFASYFPQTRLGLMFLPIYFPIRGFLIGAAVLSAGLVVAEQVTGNSMGGISHFGHLSGMVVGFAYLHIDKLRKIGKR